MEQTKQIAKMLKYIGCDTAADVWFGIFLVGWVVTRHIFYPWTVWAAIFGFPRLAPYKFSPEQGYFLNFFTHVGFVVLLVGLQVILCLWLYLIVKVVRRCCLLVFQMCKEWSGYSPTMWCAGRCCRSRRCSGERTPTTSAATVSCTLLPLSPRALLRQQNRS